MSVEELTEAMGVYIATKTDTDYGTCTFEGLAFDGCCVPISPKHEGQAIPEALQGIDDGGWE